jgi:uncharacterized protein YqjF (DUF2071 family)
MSDESRSNKAMQEFRVRTSGRPRPLPPGRWALTQRWNDLLFAHWPVPPVDLAERLPEGLQIDTFEGSAWLSVTPFWTDRIKIRGVPPLPGLRCFPELSLRTYVREQRTGLPGIYTFSLEVGSLLALLVGRTAQHLPCHWADMRVEQRGEREISYFSRRRLTASPVIFQARYRGLGPTRKTAEWRAGSLEYFLLERSCQFTSNHAGLTQRANLHYVSWPLEAAEAQIEQNGLAEAIGIHLPLQPPVMHYSRRMAVYIWPAELVRAKLTAHPVRVAVTPS